MRCRRRIQFTVCIFTGIILCTTSCSRDPTSPSSEITYHILPPEGSLPWPQHNPSFSQSEYDGMMRNLWIINNFGQYQGGDTRESMYFHNGLDVVLENGTPIYAVASGFVRSIRSYSESYSTVIIEDEETPGYAWEYTHVYHFEVEEGDYVPQGTYIADVNFIIGLGHIHLGRAFLADGGLWDNLSDHRYIQPDGYFSYSDSDPPVIQSFFYYFANNSDSLIGWGDQSPVSGEVDIVVGIREQGRYARRESDGFGDRLCVTRIEYTIADQNHSIIENMSFDFSKLILRSLSIGDEPLVLTVYKFWYVMHPNPPTSWSRVVSYYVITNCDGTGEFGLVDPQDQTYSWDTTVNDQNGDPLYPDGEYSITVTAYDFKGNNSSRTVTVQVDNSQDSTRK